MKLRKYEREYGVVLVEECTLKEFVDAAFEMLDYGEFADSLGIVVDGSVWIEYKDGSTCSFFDGYGKEGKFKSSRIRFGIIDNGSTYQVYGKYVVDENGVVQKADQR